jgi:hypothetical protein
MEFLSHGFDCCHEYLGVLVGVEVGMVHLGVLESQHSPGEWLDFLSQFEYPISVVGLHILEILNQFLTHLRPSQLRLQHPLNKVLQFLIASLRTQSSILAVCWHLFCFLWLRDEVIRFQPTLSSLPLISLRLIWLIDLIS